jgi:hypothetical protein
MAKHERIPAPGTVYGPCSDPCEHVDCAQARAKAGKLCVRCAKPIGYEISFYQTEYGDYAHGCCSETLIQDIFREFGDSS